MTILYNETLVKNNFSFWYIVIWRPEHTQSRTPQNPPFGGVFWRLTPSNVGVCLEMLSIVEHHRRAPRNASCFFIFCILFFLDGAKSQVSKEKYSSKKVPKLYPISEYDFQKIDKNDFILSCSHLYVSCDALNCTKWFHGGLQTRFYV